MGGYIARVGRYKAYYGDFCWDYIKRRKPKEYYENYKFTITITDVVTKKETDVQVPILNNFVTIKLLKKNYDFEYIEGDVLFKWLFKRVIEKERLFGIPYISNHWGQYPTNWAYYYLKSEIGQYPIKLEGGFKECKKDCNDKKCYKRFGCTDINVLEIKDYKQIEWLSKNGFGFVWTDKNGNEF